MNLPALRIAVSKFQSELFRAITTSSYNGKSYTNGLEAKEALIRSQSLIMNIHESVKVSLFNSLNDSIQLPWSVHPPIGQNNPELKLYGLLKAKKQDLVFLSSPRESSMILSGLNDGEIDDVGIKATSKAIVVGIRSQMSSIDKNFDTLMERAFAETLNMRLRTNNIIMAEVYLLPIKEFSTSCMRVNTIGYEQKHVNISKYIRIFNSFSSQNRHLNDSDIYKYDSTALVLIDFEKRPAFVITSGAELKEYGYPDEICNLFDKISPTNFDKRVIQSYNNFNPL